MRALCFASNNDSFLLLLLHFTYFLRNIIMQNERIMSRIERHALANATRSPTHISLSTSPSMSSNINQTTMPMVVVVVTVSVVRGKLKQPSRLRSFCCIFVCCLEYLERRNHIKTETHEATIEKSHSRCNAAAAAGAHMNINKFCV